MTDLADASAGAIVVMATSSDPRHPPQNIIDGNENTFWITTGLFPQEFIIALPQTVQVSFVKTHTVNVRKLEFERCDGAQPVNFEKVFDHSKVVRRTVRIVVHEVLVALEDRNGKMQVETHKMSGVLCRYLRFTITAAYDDFAAVHKITVEGTPA